MLLSTNGRQMDPRSNPRCWSVKSPAIPSPSDSMEWMEIPWFNSIRPDLFSVCIVRRLIDGAGLTWLLLLDSCSWLIHFVRYFFYLNFVGKDGRDVASVRPVRDISIHFELTAIRTSPPVAVKWPPHFHRPHRESNRSLVFNNPQDPECDGLPWMSFFKAAGVHSAVHFSWHFSWFFQFSPPSSFRRRR